jgi:hypothetical protein
MSPCIAFIQGCPGRFPTHCGCRCRGARSGLAACPAAASCTCRRCGCRQRMVPFPPPPSSQHSPLYHTGTFSCVVPVVPQGGGPDRTAAGGRCPGGCRRPSLRPLQPPPARRPAGCHWPLLRRLTAKAASGVAAWDRLRRVLHLVCGPLQTAAAATPKTPIPATASSHPISARVTPSPTH